MCMTHTPQSESRTTESISGSPSSPVTSLITWAPASNAFTVTDGSGNANLSFNVPNNGSLAGLVLFHQWAVLDNANNLGIVTSNAGRALVGN